MPYDSIVSRTDAAALVPESVSNDLLKGLTYTSAALALSRRTTISTSPGEACGSIDNGSDEYTRAP